MYIRYLVLSIKYGLVPEVDGVACVYVSLACGCEGILDELHRLLHAEVFSDGYRAR